MDRHVPLAAQREHVVGDLVPHSNRGRAGISKQRPCEILCPALRQSDWRIHNEPTRQACFLRRDCDCKRKMGAKRPISARHHGATARRIRHHGQAQARVWRAGRGLGVYLRGRNGYNHPRPVKARKLSRLPHRPTRHRFRLLSGCARFC